MRTISKYAGLALNKVMDALIGSDPCPLGGVLDYGWQVDGNNHAEGEAS